MTANEELGFRLTTLFALLFGAVMGFAVGYSHGSGCAAVAEQQKAAEAHAGHWVVNPQTGERVFVYEKDGAP